MTLGYAFVGYSYRFGRRTCHTIRKITNLKCKTLLVTANPNAKYRKHFDKVITLPTLSGDWEYDSISPIMFDIFTELLVTHYAKQMKN
ncbi:MAG: hypothetical protein MSE70_02275 [Streptococcus sp.]|uniref:hypothetical protein n=1 Tax=Streptococcus sp. TaxID=1306 RepID=UPI0025909662|nr:hypothetical protein [Streptococcus sp.]MCI7515897.1 hypothetical protein [Streptococcus sp.]